MHIHNRLLLRGGLVAGPLFVGSFLVQGKTRHDYSPLRHPVSSLALGPRGWMQIANFAVTGGLSLCFAVGLSHTSGARIRTRLGPVLLGGAAVGMLGAAAFRTDPVSGYPPGTPDSPSAASPLGMLHDLFSVPTFLCVPAAGSPSAVRFSALESAAGRRTPRLLALACWPPSRWPAWASASSTAQRKYFVEIGGALQRASIAIGFAWLTSLAARAL